MSQYAVIAPTFWNGETGKKIRKKGTEAQVVALYLMSCPHRNALGLYYLPKVLLAHEVGLPLEGASKALLSLFEVGFCAYDEDSEVVWVYSMATFQIGEQLKKADHRVKWINEKYAELPKNPFLKEFYDKYVDVFHLEKPRESKPLPRPLQGPSKPDSDSDTDSDTETEDCSELQGSSEQPAEPERVPVVTIPLRSKKEQPEEHPVFQEEIDEWVDAYPAVDVIQELKRIRQWNLSNPKKQKSKNGIRGHITRWLDREQNRGGSKNHMPGRFRRTPANETTGNEDFDDLEVAYDV